MNRLIKYIYGCIVLLGCLVSSCRQEQPVEATLEVSAQTLAFDVQTKSKTIDIKTNQSEWHFLVGVKWLECKKEGNQLILTAQPNETGQSRHASLAITAGKLVEHIDIEQSGDMGGVSTPQATYSLDQWEGKLAIPIKSSTSSWQIKISDEWIQATPNLIKGEILVHVDENSGRDERTATILVEDASSASALSISITQQGVQWFILPYLGFGEGIEPIKAFELARKSELRPNTTTQGHEETWIFDTHSPIFYRMEYTLTKGKLMRAVIYMPIAMFQREQEALFQYLAGQGFAEEGNLIINRALGVSVKYGRTSTGKEVAFMFESIPVQPNPQATFDSFPLFFGTQPEWYKKKEADISAWAKEHGFEYSETLSGEDKAQQIKKLTYFPVDEQAALSQMAFYLSTNSVDRDMPIKNIFMTYQDQPKLLGKFFWERNGQYHITNEFLALARSSGYLFVGKNNAGVHIFANESTSTLFGVKVVVPREGSYLKPFVMTQIEYSK